VKINLVCTNKNDLLSPSTKVFSAKISGWVNPPKFLTTKVLCYAVCCICWLVNARYHNIKIGNLKRKNQDHKIVLKQNKDAGNLQILLYLRSLF